MGYYGYLPPKYLLTALRICGGINERNNRFLLSVYPQENLHSVWNCKMKQWKVHFILEARLYKKVE